MCVLSILYRCYAGHAHGIVGDIFSFYTRMVAINLIISRDAYCISMMETITQYTMRIERLLTITLMTMGKEIAHNFTNNQ